MKVMIFGGGRFQGRRTAELFVAAGHDVTVINRASGAPKGARYVAGDVDLADTLKAALHDQDYDAVVDNRAYDPDQLQCLLQRLKDHAGHYVLVSSLVVYHHADEQAYGLITEDEADLAAETGSEYDVGKRRCEVILRSDGGIPWTILRPAQIEGPGDPSNRRGFWIDRVADGGGLLIPSDFCHPYQPVSRDDVALAVVAATCNSAAFRRTYNIAGVEIFTVTEWLSLIASALGVPAPYVVSLPMTNLRALVGFEYKLPLPMRPLLDIGAAKTDLGWRPTTANQWLPESVDWWRSAGLTSRFWEYRSQEISAIQRIAAGLSETAPGVRKTVTNEELG